VFPSFCSVSSAAKYLLGAKQPLQRLDLSDTKMSTEGLKALADAFRDRAKVKASSAFLEYLDLSDNKLGQGMCVCCLCVCSFFGSSYTSFLLLT
jgi:hypothetical protein